MPFSQLEQAEPYVLFYKMKYFKSFDTINNLDVLKLDGATPC